MTYLGGGTNDADAIQFTGQEVFSQNHGARGEVPRIAVLVTNGDSANPGAAIAAADKMRTENIGVIAVDIGSNSYSDRIADTKEGFFKVQSYNNLDSITDKLIEQMCKGSYFNVSYFSMACSH